MTRQRVLRSIMTILSVIGILFTFWFIASASFDLMEADETSGGYDYPYEGWTGTPIEFTQWYVTDTGLFHRGRVIDLDLDCTAGQLKISLLGIARFNFRPFSDRAKVVHQPQVACWERGFDTSVWDSIDDPQGLYTALTSANNGR